MLRLVAALAVAVTAASDGGSPAAPPADWQRKIDAADALFSADDSLGALPWRSQAGIGNGMLGGIITGSQLNLAGVFSGSMRASVPTGLLSARLASTSSDDSSHSVTTAAGNQLTAVGVLLDLREATYSRRYTGRLTSPSGCTDPGMFSVEQRFYVHRAVPSVTVMEVAVSIPCGCTWGHNVTLVVSQDQPNNNPATPDPQTVKFTNMSLMDGANVSVGATVHPEGGGDSQSIPISATFKSKKIRFVLKHGD